MLSLRVVNSVIQKDDVRFSVINKQAALDLRAQAGLSAVDTISSAQNLAISLTAHRQSKTIDPPLSGPAWPLVLHIQPQIAPTPPAQIAGSLVCQEHMLLLAMVTKMTTTMMMMIEDHRGSCLCLTKRIECRGVTVSVKPAHQLILPSP